MLTGSIKRFEPRPFLELSVVIYLYQLNVAHISHPLPYCFLFLSGGVQGVCSQGLCGAQPPGGRPADAAAVRLGRGAAHVPAQLSLLHGGHRLHPPHHIQHHQRHCHFPSSHHHDHPR